MALGLVLLMNIGTYVYLDRENDHDLSVAQTKLEYQATVFGGHLKGSLDAIRTMLDELSDNAGLYVHIDGFDMANMEAMLSIKAARQSNVSSILILNHENQIVSASSDREYLGLETQLTQLALRHRRQGAEVLITGLQMAQGEQRDRYVAMSHVVESRTQEYGGLVVALLPESYFTLFREAADVGSYEFVIVSSLWDGPLSSWFLSSMSANVPENRIVQGCLDACTNEPASMMLFTLEDTFLPLEVAAYRIAGYDLRVFVGRSHNSIFGEREVVRSRIMAGVFVVSMVVLTIAILAVSKAIQSARAELRNRKLSMAIGDAATGVVVTDADGHVEYVNRAFEMIVGRSARDLPQQSLGGLIAGDGSPGLVGEVNKALARGQRWSGEVSGKKPNGEYFWLMVNAAQVFGDKGVKEGFVGLAEDISKSKRDQENIHLADVVFETASEAILICDANKSIIRVNPAFESTTGYSAEEVVGKTPSILTSGRHDREFYKDMHDQLAETGRWEGEITNRKKNGELYVEWLSINAVQDEDGETVLYASVFMDITKRKATEALIRRQANYDRLTDLPNRHLLHDRLERVVAESHRSKTMCAVLFVDLDRFKWINDHRGHAVGDRMLIEVANRLRACVRVTDTVARIGGDEFTIILGDITKIEAVEQLAQKVLRALDRPMSVDHGDLHVSGSIGVALYPNDGVTPEELLRKADQAMYRAKNAGRNAVRFFEAEMNEAAARRADMTSKLHAACTARDVIAYYQPIFSMETGRYVGAECLARWQDGDRLISPAEFIPIAEDSGQIDHVLDSILANVGEDVASWRSELPPDFYFSVNIAPRQFFSASLVTNLLRFLGANGLSPHQFVLEITENVGLEDQDQAFARIRQLRDLGFRIALDDFGAGYSSLGYLQSLAVDILKIDRAFVSDLPGSLESRAIIETVAVLSQRLGIKTIAEGVETQEQMDYLRSTGCSLGQGYLISKPLRPEDFLSSVEANLKSAPLPDLPPRHGLKLINP